MAALLDFSPTLACDFLDWADAALDIDDGLSGDIRRIAQLMRKYHDLPADLADASLLALCERRSIGEIATIDRDFTIYRLANRRALTNVFETG